MKRLSLVAVLVIFAAAGASLILLAQRTTSPAPPDEAAAPVEVSSVSPAVRIGMSSAPFPMSVGPAELLILLTDSAGNAVDGASVTAYGRMADMGMGHAGELPISGRTQTSTDGLYRVQMTMPMMGQWIVDVSATTPDGETVQDQFVTFVYATAANTSMGGGRTSYASVREIEAEKARNPAQEMWVVIPLGTDAMMRAGHWREVIPAELLLSVEGQNTLVIRNNDIVNHTIGPFFIRSGETIRQTFTSPAEYQGVCTIRANSSVSIVVQ